MSGNPEVPVENVQFFCPSNNFNDHHRTEIAKDVTRASGLPGGLFWGESPPPPPPPKRKSAIPPKILPSKVPFIMQIMIFNRVLPSKQNLPDPPPPQAKTWAYFHEMTFHEFTKDTSVSMAMSCWRRSVKCWVFEMCVPLRRLYVIDIQTYLGVWPTRGILFCIQFITNEQVKLATFTWEGSISCIIILAVSVY